MEAVDCAAWDLAHEAFTLPIASPADLRAKLELAAPEIDAALDAAGHSTLHTFPLRRPAAPVQPPPPSPAETRHLIEEAAQTALDTADHLLRILDRMDGDADHEDGGDAEPSLAAPENPHGNQVVWLRGNDGDREAKAPETVLPIAAAERAMILPAPLPWGGRGNVVAAAGVVVLEMVAAR